MAIIRMTMSGFCQHPSEGSHEWCERKKLSCTCPCHNKEDGEK